MQETNHPQQFSSTEVQKLRNQMLEIGNQRKDEKFVAEDGSELSGGVELDELYSKCLKWSEMVLER